MTVAEPEDVQIEPPDPDEIVTPGIDVDRVVRCVERDKDIEQPAVRIPAEVELWGFRYDPQS